MDNNNNVGAIPGTGIVVENQKREEANADQEDKKRRVSECQAKITEILAQYQCFTEVYMTIGTNGHVKAEIQIIAK